MELNTILLFFFYISFLTLVIISSFLQKKKNDAVKKVKKLLLREKLFKQNKQKLAQAYKNTKEELDRLTLQLKRKALKENKSNKEKNQNQNYKLIEQQHKDENIHLKRKIEHLNEQVSVLTSQLKNQGDEYQELKKSQINQKKYQQNDFENLILKLKQEQNILKEKTVYQNQQHNKALLDFKKQKQCEERKTEEDIKKLKKKLKHYQHFYTISLNQKNMLEEKIINWEKALKILSNWILKKIPSEANKDFPSMGDLVASAIETTGYGSLVEDEFNFKNNNSKLINLRPKKESQKEPQ